MKDYSAMSDFEINKRVLEAKHGTKGLPYAHSADGRSVGYFDVSRNYQWYDYCNNPADAWPIIIDNRIAILPAPHQGEWKAAHRAIGEDSTPHFFNQSANGLRAAMIVYLQMMEQKK